MSRPSFNVLMVCSGNLCRSPIAEQLLRTKTLGHPVVVSSAGVIAEEGLAMAEEAALVSRRHGGEPSAHRSRQLTEAQLEDADLVLTATRAHRSSVVQLLPRMSRRTFTISEFARLVSAVPESEWRLFRDAWGLLDAARSLRGLVLPPEDPEEDDIEDPYRRPLEVYETVGTRIDAAIDVIAGRIRLRGAGQ